MEVASICGLINGTQIVFFMKHLVMKLYMMLAGSKVGAKLSTVLRGKIWCWQPTRSCENSKEVAYGVYKLL